MENKAKRGCPQLKNYNPSALQQDLISAVAEVYADTKEIKATALELGLPPNKVKKLLITGGILTYPQTKEIRDMMREGKSIMELHHRLPELSFPHGIRPFVLLFPQDRTEWSVHKGVVYRSAGEQKVFIMEFCENSV